MSSALSTVTNTLLTSAISELLPFGSSSLKITAGMFASELLKSAIGLKNNKYINKWFGSKCLVIDSTDKLIYNKYEEYIVNKYFDSINKCHIIPKNSEISVMLTSNTFLTPLYDTYKEHKINIKIDKKSSATTGENVNENCIFIIDSKTADMNILKMYVKESINFINKSKSKLLTIYKSVTEEYTNNKEKKYVTDWDKIYVNTNKNFKNTIVSEYVSKNFYEDVKKFMNNEAYYAEKGVPYKRGYLLHGLPGCGKSSLVKALANEFSLDIFSIDLETITNENLSKLITEINYLTNNTQHILVFEDIDRSKIFKPHTGYYRDDYDKKDDVTIGNLINILDGIVESNGRIVIMSANDIGNIIKHKAFARPGRIDKIIELKKCDNYQIKKLFELFYPENDSNIIDKKMSSIKQLTPAECVQNFQQNQDDYLQSLDDLCNESIIEQLIDQNDDDVKGCNNTRKNKKIVYTAASLNTAYKRLNKQMERNISQNTKIVKLYNQRKRKLLNDIEKMEQKNNSEPARKRKRM